MLRAKSRARAAVGLFLALCTLVACNGDGGTAPTTPPPPPPPEPGAVRVVATTTGEDIDPDGYTVDVDGDARALGANDEANFDDLEAGDYTVELSGVRANCSLAGENPRTLTVPEASTAETTFEVQCLDAVVGEVAFFSDRAGVGGLQIFLQAADGPAVKQLTDGFRNLDPAVSPDGTKVLFVSGREDASGDIYVMNADGTGVTRLTSVAEAERYPAWSPDGSRISFQRIQDGAYDIFVMNADGSDAVNLTDNPAHDLAPHWSPDGSRIAFSTRRDGNFEIYVMDADGTDAVNLTNTAGEDQFPEWSPDGSRIAFSSNRNGKYDLYLMDTDGTNLFRLTDDPENDYLSSWSPDGSRLAFISERDGNGEIYIIDVDGTGLVNLTNNPAQDLTPSWGPFE